MKIIAIGDLHGKTIWKDIVEKETFDKVVFVGDYFDCFEKISPSEQLYNFKEIVEYKRSNPDKVIILLGNHDFHYLPNIFEDYSGYQPAQRYNFGLEIDNAIKDKLIQACFIHEDIIFTHAGVGKNWCDDIFETESPDNLEERINDELTYRPHSFRFTPGLYNYSPYGDDETQTPIWIRPRALKQCKIEGYRQVVGHTANDFIKLRNDDVIIIDVLDKVNEYLIINDGKFEIGKL